MKILCRFKHLPRPIRLAAAWALIGVGFSLWVTPFPGGIVLITLGVMILYCAYPSLRRRISGLLLRGPRMTARFAPLLCACDRCTQNEPASSCTGRPARFPTADELRN